MGSPGTLNERCARTFFHASSCRTTFLCCLHSANKSTRPADVSLCLSLNLCLSICLSMFLALSVSSLCVCPWRERRRGVSVQTACLGLLPVRHRLPLSRFFAPYIHMLALVRCMAVSFIACLSFSFSLRRLFMMCRVRQHSCTCLSITAASSARSLYTSLSLSRFSWSTRRRVSVQKYSTCVRACVYTFASRGLDTDREGGEEGELVRAWVRVCRRSTSFLCHRAGREAAASHHTPFGLLSVCLSLCLGFLLSFLFSCLGVLTYYLRLCVLF